MLIFVVFFTILFIYHFPFGADRERRPNPAAMGVLTHTHRSTQTDNHSLSRSVTVGYLETPAHADLTQTGRPENSQLFAVAQTGAQPTVQQDN